MGNRDSPVMMTPYFGKQLADIHQRNDLKSIVEDATAAEATTSAAQAELELFASGGDSVSAEARTAMTNEWNELSAKRRRTTSTTMQPSSTAVRLKIENDVVEAVQSSEGQRERMMRLATAQAERERRSIVGASATTQQLQREAVDMDIDAEGTNDIINPMIIIPGFISMRAWDVPSDMVDEVIARLSGDPSLDTRFGVNFAWKEDGSEIKTIVDVNHLPSWAAQTPPNLRNMYTDTADEKRRKAQIKYWTARNGEDLPMDVEFSASDSDYDDEVADSDSDLEEGTGDDDGDDRGGGGLPMQIGGALSGLFNPGVMRTPKDAWSALLNPTAFVCVA